MNLLLKLKSLFSLHKSLKFDKFWTIHYLKFDKIYIVENVIKHELFKRWSWLLIVDTKLPILSARCNATKFNSIEDAKNSIDLYNKGMIIDGIKESF